MTKSPQELNQLFAIDGVLSFEHSTLGGLVVRVSSPEAEAQIALRGGQLLSWTPTGHDPVLWLSPLSRLDDARPVRGGIPVCWPWFGPHPHDKAAPSHGYARTAAWSVVRSSRAGASTLIALSLDPGPEDNGCSLEIEFRIGAELEIALNTHNPSRHRVAISQALHTYFAVGDISQARIEGLSHMDYVDKLDANRHKNDQHPLVTFDREVDRIYLGAADATIVDESLDRAIRISSAGTSRSTVLWNPWTDKTLRLGDMPPDSFRNMVCLETANVDEDALTLEPGASHKLISHISVGPAPIRTSAD